MGKNTEELVEGPVGELLGEVPVERVVDETVAHTFNVRAVVGVLSQFTTVCVENPVPIKSDARIIGYGSLYIADKDRYFLLADMYINYATPERFTIETKGQKLYARAVGDIVHNVNAQSIFWPTHLEILEKCDTDNVLTVLGEPIL